jgi:hypothetical protein
MKSLLVKKGLNAIPTHPPILNELRTIHEFTWVIANPNSITSDWCTVCMTDKNLSRFRISFLEILKKNYH